MFHKLYEEILPRKWQINEQIKSNELAQSIHEF